MIKGKPGIVFFGSSRHSLPILEVLDKDYELVGIVSQIDSPVGRKKILTPTPVSVFAREKNIPLFQPESLAEKPWEIKEPEKLLEFIKKIKSNLIVTACFGQKIPSPVINYPKYGALNLHPSLLPQYPGSSPAVYAIIDGQKETGITIIKMNEKFDAGEIVFQEKEPIFDNDIPETLYQRLFLKGAGLLEKILPDYLAGKIILKTQGQRTTVYARRLTKKDGLIDWHWPAEKIERFIRAMTPWPSAWTLITIQNRKSKDMLNQRLKILNARMENSKLILDKVQLEGKKPVLLKEFEKAHHLSIYK